MMETEVLYFLGGLSTPLLAYLGYKIPEKIKEKWDNRKEIKELNLVHRIKQYIIYSKDPTQEDKLKKAIRKIGIFDEDDVKIEYRKLKNSFYDYEIEICIPKGIINMNNYWSPKILKNFNKDFVCEMHSITSSKENNYVSFDILIALSDKEKLEKAKNGE